MGKIAKEAKKEIDPLVLVSTLITIGISVISLILSIVTYFDMIDSKPLHYYVKSNVISVVDNEIEMKVELNITSGTINSVKILTYDNENFSVLSDIICNYTKRDGTPSCSVSLDIGKPLNEEVPFSYALYILATGTDGSETLGMMRYHIVDADIDNETITVETKYYTFEDILLAEQSESEQQYSHLFDNFRKLRALLREKNEL